MVPPKLLEPIPDAQIMLGNISRSTLYELIESGEIKKVNIGRRAFITAESIHAYVARLAENASRAQLFISDRVPSSGEASTPVPIVSSTAAVDRDC